MFTASFEVIRYELNSEGCVNDLYPSNYQRKRCRSERTADAHAERLGKQALAGRVPIAIEWDGAWGEADGTKRDTLVLRRRKDGRLLGEVRVLYGEGWDK